MARATDDLIDIKISIKLQKSQELKHKIFKKQLQMKQKTLDVIKKCQNKDIYREIRQKIIDDLRSIY